MACSAPLPIATAAPALPAAASPTASPTAATTPSPTAVVGIEFPGVTALSAPLPSVVWAVTDNKRLFRSTDQGATWVERLGPGTMFPTSSIAFISAEEGWLLRRGSPATECMAQGFELWRTRDGAASWELIARADSNFRLNDISFRQCKGAPTFADGKIGILTADDANGEPTIYRTADGGATWRSTRLSDPPGLAPGTAGRYPRNGSARRWCSRRTRGATASSSNSCCDPRITARRGHPAPRSRVETSSLCSAGRVGYALSTDSKRRQTPEGRGIDLSRTT